MRNFQPDFSLDEEKIGKTDTKKKQKQTNKRNKVIKSRMSDLSPPRSNRFRFSIAFWNHLGNSQVIVCSGIVLAQRSLAHFSCIQTKARDRISPLTHKLVKPKKALTPFNATRIIAMVYATYAVSTFSTTQTITNHIQTASEVRQDIYFLRVWNSIGRFFYWCQTLGYFTRLELTETHNSLLFDGSAEFKNNFQTEKNVDAEISKLLSSINTIYPFSRQNVKTETPSKNLYFFVLVSFKQRLLKFQSEFLFYVSFFTFLYL